MHENFEVAVQALIDCFRNGGKLLLCGNGGSAADCGHILGEFVKGFEKKRPLSPQLLEKIGEPWAANLQQGLPVVDLTANSALIAAVINDIDGDSVYAQQVTAYAKPGDVILGISTSGNAENVCRALKVAKAMGAKTMGMTGMAGGRMKSLCDILLNVEETRTYKVQELHLKLYHQLCLRVEEAFFEN